MQEVPIVLIGHKDHGKSTLIGRLLLDTKSIKESKLKEIQDVDKALGYKFELAHLVDSFREEREREMTMDTTMVLLKGQKQNYQLIDVPGHAELISNMLTGASGAKTALLVVSVEEGIKEQTRQHLEIAKLLGIEQLEVVVNKMDKVNYKKEKFDEVVKSLKEILNTIGYLSEKIHFFPVSAWVGDNVTKKSEKMPWYQEKTLMEFLEKDIKTPEPLVNLPLSFLVQDTYSEPDGEILVGRIETGKLNVGQEIIFLPGKEKSKIKKINGLEGELKEAMAGQNIGISLFEVTRIKRGMVGTSDFKSFQVGNNLSGEIFWIEKPTQKQLILECGTAQVLVNLIEPSEVNQSVKTSYKFSLNESIVVDNKYKTILSKIVLKDRGKIIAVGNIK